MSVRNCISSSLIPHPSSLPSPNPNQPRTGHELAATLAVWDASAARMGLCQPGGLIAAVKEEAALSQHLAGDVARWPDGYVKTAIEDARRYFGQRRAIILENLMTATQLPWDRLTCRVTWPADVLTSQETLGLTGVASAVMS